MTVWRWVYADDILDIQDTRRTSGSSTRGGFWKDHQSVEDSPVCRGFIVSKRGIEIDPVKVRAILANKRMNRIVSSDGCYSYGGSYLNIPTGVNLSTKSFKEGHRE